MKKLLYLFYYLSLLVVQIAKKSIGVEIIPVLTEKKKKLILKKL